MIAPEPTGGSHTRLGALLGKGLVLSALIFAALELWRPCFFLTDDNLDGAFPALVEIGHNLLAGQSPFLSHHLFGGDYNLLRDPAFFCWHPLYLLTSLLAGTPFRNLIVDVDALALLLLATAGFIVLANFLRREYQLAISDGWVLFFALSYTYSMIALTTGASWLTFLGDHSALPWLALGILQRRWIRGVVIVAIFVVHQTLGGHLAPTTSNSIFMSLFAAGMAISRRSLGPLANWLAGYLIAMAIVSPLLIPMLGGFEASIRSQGVTLTDMQNNNIPGLEFPLSLLLGIALWLGYSNPPPNATYTLALGSSAAAWCLLPALLPAVAHVVVRGFKSLALVVKRPAFDQIADKIYGWEKKRLDAKEWRLVQWTGLEVVTLAVAAFGMVLICRPVWITEIMMQLPIFKSMRWPFRELIQFQFFLHLFLLVRPSGLREDLRRYSALFGTIALVIPMVLYPQAPTFNSMAWDRELVLSGGVERYWAQVRPLLKPTDRIAVLIPVDVYAGDRFEEPYSLLGTYNYAVLADVINAWGYSPTVPRDQVYTDAYAYYPFGAYRLEQKEALMREKPDLKFITLESLRPLRITLSSKDGPTIDLTPFVPERVSKDPGPPPK